MCYVTTTAAHVLTAEYDRRVYLSSREIWSGITFYSLHGLKYDIIKYILTSIKKCQNYSKLCVNQTELILKYRQFSPDFKVDG